MTAVFSLDRTLATALLLLSMLLAGFPATAEVRSFSHPGIARDADRYENWLKSNWRPAKGQQPQPQALRTAGEKMLAAGTDPRGASRSFASAVVADPSDAQAWLGLARALLAVPADSLSGSDRYEMPLNASGAAYRAYQRSRTDAQKATALVVLAEALKRRSFWRPALDAYRASLELAERPDVRAAYEVLRGEHGFRIVEYKVEQDTTTPRLCIQLSERIATGQHDPAKFVAVGGKDPQGVTVDGQQLCIEGLTHGQRYEVQIRAGLPSESGDLLTKASELGIYVRDRTPAVRFPGRNYVLPSRGQQGIPVVTVNTDQIDVEVFRIGERSLVGTIASGDFQRQLSTYELDQLRERTGVTVFKGTMDVARRTNEDVTTAVPVADVIGTLKPGVYAMVARPSGVLRDDHTLATQWFIVSDLGLTALSGETGVHIFVRSLTSAAPVAGAKVRLVARNNEVLGEMTADANGYARFANALQKGEGGLAPALALAEGADGTDHAFLDLATAAFDLSDRGVTGREAPGPIDAWLYTDRGVYRPGESVHLTALVRDRANIASTLPTTLIVTRPDGVEHRRVLLSDQGLGGRTIELPLGAAMTGTWRARLHPDPKADALSSVAFLVEDFVPERIDMRLEAGTQALAPQEPATIEVTGRYLYGPAAADLTIEGDIVVRPATTDAGGLAGFVFGLAEQRISPVRKALEGLPRTGADGKARVAFELPPVERTQRPLEADVIVRLREPGGRTIERMLTMPVDLKLPRVGIKPLFADRKLGEGDTARFEAVFLDGSDNRLDPKDLTWQLVRLDQSWQWYSRDGEWAYEPVTLTRKIADGRVEAGANGIGHVTAAVEYGRYRLEIASPGGPASSLLFTAGWYGGEAIDSPEQLEIALDKASYRAGDTAKLRIASRQPGKALVSVLGNGLLFHQLVDVPRGGGDIAVPITETMGAGAYVTAILYRSMDEAAKRMPSRAIGVRWLALDQSERILNVDIDTPAQIRSGSRLSVPIKVKGLSPGDTARVTVAAVDVGILNLTRFQAPAPEAWFYAQRRLGVEVRDYYGRLIDGMRGERGRLRSGGDGAGMSMQGSPPVEETVALFSGIVTVGSDATATIDFDVPDFNGTVRLMAVAWSRDRIGHGVRDVVVRDAVALLASGPRFLAYGDEARIELDLHNIELATADLAVSVEQETPAGTRLKVLDRRVTLGQGERRSEHVMVKPTELGPVVYSVRVAGPDGLEIRRRLSLDVKPPAADIRRVTTSKLAPNGRLTLSRDLLADLIPGRTRLSVSIGPTASLDVPSLLTQLDRYPYGCAEQTVSRALPLLYVNDVARQIGIAGDGQLKDRVQKAVERVFEMQDGSGAFGVWGPSGGDLWLTSYVTDFLTRAKELGFAVKAQGLALALDRLQNYVAYAQDFQRGGEARAYALYVLARNGRAPIGELRYFVDTRLDRFATPLAQAQLGAALAMVGESERAERAFRAALDQLATAKDADWRGDYGSSLRDGAALVTLAAESRAMQSETPRLATVLAAALGRRAATSTQEQAWLLLAAKALSDQAAGVRLAIGGAEHQGPLDRVIAPTEITGQALTITNVGSLETDAVVSVIGASLTPEPPVSRGLAIERSYYTLDGKKVPLTSATGGTAELSQTDRLVVVLKVELPEQGGRLLLVDRLPAGLQIENPRLVDSGDVRSLEWLKSALKPQHTEFRDDRFVAAFNVKPKSAQSGGGTLEDGDENGSEDDTDTQSARPQPAQPADAARPTATVAYIVRAVTAGRFAHPAATVEDMYRPERFARTAAGRLEIKVKR